MPTAHTDRESSLSPHSSRDLAQELRRAPLTCDDQFPGKDVRGSYRLLVGPALEQWRGAPEYESGAAR